MNALIFYRIGHCFHRSRLTWIGRLFTLLGRLLLGAYIPSSCVIGKGTQIAYGGSGIVVHRRAVIGRDCLLSPGAVIGGRAGSRDVPVLEDGVQVYAGAKILGPIRIGAGAVIGANAVVIHDVPPRAVLVAPLARTLGHNARPLIGDGE